MALHMGNSASRVCRIGESSTANVVYMDWSAAFDKVPHGSLETQETADARALSTNKLSEELNRSGHICGGNGISDGPFRPIGLG